MKTSYRKAFLAFTIGVFMVGCTKAPGAVSPGQDNLQPGVGVVNPSINNPSCGDGTVAPPVAPVVPPVVPFVAPLCNFLAFTANIGCHDKLFLYDDILKDNYALPGAGENINNPQYFDGGKIIFDRCGQILVYDLLGEVVCNLNDINGLGIPVHRPSASWLGDKVVFTDFCGRAYLWCCNPCISLCELAKINAVGKINWIRISADGLWAVFTTCEGCLYIYDICNPAVCLIADARLVCDVEANFDDCDFDCRPCHLSNCGSDCQKDHGFSKGSGHSSSCDKDCDKDHSYNPYDYSDYEDDYGRDRDCSDLAFITHPAISATGRQIAFTAVTFDKKGCPQTSIWRYDRVLCCLDPMPFANAALNADVVLDPLFKCYDEENIYYEALIPGFRTSRDRAKIDFRLYSEDELADLVTGIVSILCRMTDTSFVEDVMPLLEQPDNLRGRNDQLACLIRKIVCWLHNQTCEYDRVVGKIWDRGHSHTILEGYRVLDYNWLTETVRTLTIVNNVHGDTETLISDPDLFCCPDFRDNDGKYGNRDGRSGYGGYGKY